ncbi:MAG: hypothetical protein OXC69_08685 [Candidatus Tectomicrobia bacterium]|nr:hypothetical protein [Candidatus Tectomicrobia bacterium]
MKTFPMRNAVGVFLAMPESIHQASREGNLPMCDKAALSMAAAGDATGAPPMRLDASILLISFGVPRESRVKVSDGHRKAAGGLPAGRANGVGWPQMATGLSAWWPQESATGFRKAG